MILGVGTDIVEIKRIKNALIKSPHRFLARVFTPYEQEYCLKKREPALYLAGRFAAKEAVVKALGTGFSEGISWLDIEVRNDPSGKPAAFLSSHAASKTVHSTIHISISHCDHYATAFAVWSSSSL